MSIETTSAVFDPIQLGIRLGQRWVEKEDDNGRTHTWEVMRCSPGRVHLKLAGIMADVRRHHATEENSRNILRTKTVCPFILAFNYTKESK